MGQDADMNTKRQPVTRVRGVRCDHTFLVIGGELMQNRIYSGMRGGTIVKTIKPVQPDHDWYEGKHGEDGTEREILAPCPYPEKMHL